ncbi:hypothetical protein LUZ60_002943 [Juncus effusus]|nr:hypothetical protein LUZ60_002943 [Juncus effusus]
MASNGEEPVNVESLQVESVKALASQFSDQYEVPARYVRPEFDMGEVVTKTSSELPIIDLKKLQDPRFSEEEITKLGSACGQWGFFQLINHGVDKEIINNMKSNIREFFRLPLEQKKAVAIASNDIEGFGQHFVVSNDQKLDWADLFFVNTQPVERRNMKFWPTNPPTFRDALDKYSSELEKLAKYLLKFMANDLGIETEVLFSAFKEHPQCMRMNCYPPCPQAEKVLGLSAHTDGAAMTLLLQVDEVQGLQIRQDGKWLSVEALPGAFVVNIGDAFEMFSNGKYKSIEHRAVVNAAKERISIATFSMAPYSGMVGPLPEVVKGGKENYKTMNYLEYFRGYLSAKLEGRSYLETMRLSN